MVNVPAPTHALAPVKLQVPVMVLFGPTPPWSVSTSCPPESWAVIVIPNMPVTFPLKLPLSVKLPVSLVAPVKQEPLALLKGEIGYAYSATAGFSKCGGERIDRGP